MSALEPSSGARDSRALPIVLFLLLVLAAYANPLLTRRSFRGRDLVPYNYPLEKSVHDAWARGRLPVWFPDVSGGRPLLSNPNSGSLYPVRPLLAQVPFALAMRIYPVLHWAAAGVGMILLLSVLGASPGAAFLGATTYTFSGVLVSELYFLTILPGAALLPWAVWAVARPAAGLARRVLPAALVYGLLFLAGDVLTSGLAILFGLLWICLEEEAAGRLHRAFEIALAAVLGVLLALPQIVATALLVPETHRAVIGMKLAETFHFSVSPWRLLELVVPYPFGAVWSQELTAIWGESAFRFFFATLHAGAFALIAILALWRRPRPRGARFALFLAVAALLLAVAPKFAPRRILDWASPIPLRYPEKFCVALTLGLAMAAGLVLDRYRRVPAPRWILPVAVVLAAAACAASVWPAPAGRLAVAAVGALPPFAGEAGRKIPGALAEGGFFWVATWAALEMLRGRRAWPAAGIVLLSLLPVAANRRIARSDLEERVFAPPPFARAIARRDPHGAFRTLDESSYRPPSALEISVRPADPGGPDYSRRVWFLHTQALWGRGTVFNSDYDVGDLSRVDSLRRLSSFMATLPNAGDFFGTLALRFGIRWRDQEPVAGYRSFGHDGLQAWDENPAAKPEIRLLDHWREEPGAMEALRRIPELPLGGVVLETGREAEGAARRGRIRVLEKSPERLRLLVSVPDPTWLFVLRGFWNHRTVLLDGEPASPVPAQLAFTAVAIPAGEHRIEWREEAPGWRVSRWGPLLFLAAAAILFARGRRASSA
jgi:hypothetical protein